MRDVTQILKNIELGGPADSEQLVTVLYFELRRLAATRLHQESAPQSLTATALVHEAYLRLLGTTPPGGWAGRAHFFGAAAEAMRRILIENARRKNRLKRGGRKQRVDLDLAASMVDGVQPEILDVDDALKKLVEEDHEAGEVVKLRYFGGLTIEETAEVLEVSVRTVNRHWAYAKAWLFECLSRGCSDEPSN